MIAPALLAVVLAQALPTGHVSLLTDHLPNRSATELRARIFAEEKRDAGPHVRLAASGFVEGLVADRGGSTTDAIVEPRELTITVRDRRLELTAGLGRIVWGRLDELQPTDVVNPLDVSRFFFEGRSEARLAVPLIRAAFYASDKASVEAVYVPFFRRGRFDLLDESSSPFNLAPDASRDSGGSPLMIVDRHPAATAGNAQGGARASFTSGRVDWSVSAYDGFRPFGLYSLMPAGIIQRTYPRFTMLGGDFETTNGAWGMRGEVAAFTRDAFQAPTSAVVFTGSSIDAGGGVDRKAGAYRVSGEVLVHHESHDALARTDVSLILSTDRQFARQRYETRAFGVYNPDSRSGFLRGILTANLRDNLKVEGSLGWFAGSGEDTISRFSDSDFFYLRLRWYY